MKIEICQNWGNAEIEWLFNSSIDFSINFDTWMHEKYGILIKSGHRKELHLITDESKFAIFMLKYPEVIKKISYEN